MAPCLRQSLHPFEHASVGGVFSQNTSTFMRTSTAALILFCMMTCSLLLATDTAGTRSCYHKSKRAQNISAHLLALMELAEHAGVTTISSCQEILPATVSRDLDSRAGRGSTLVCSKAVDILRRFTQVSSECLGDEKSKGSSSSNERNAASRVSVGSQNENSEGWASRLINAKAVLSRCCGENWAVGIGTRKNESTAPLHAADCFFNASFPKLLGMVHSTFDADFWQCNLTASAISRTAVLLDDGAPALHTYTDVSDFLKELAEDVQWLITNLRHNGNRKLMEMRQSYFRLYELESSLFETTGLRFNWTEAEELNFLLCNIITIGCRGTDRYPVCNTVCERTRRLLQSLVHFVNVSEVPVLETLKEATGLCSTSEEKASECILGSENSPQGYSIIRNGSYRGIKALAGGFCFHSGCKFPLKATTDRSHWLKEQQAILRGIHSDVMHVFPDTVLPYNASLWPCGRACRDAEVTESEEEISRLFTSVCAIIVIFVAVFVIVIFYFNVQELSRKVIYRMLVCYIALSGLENIAYIIPLFGYKDIICYSDGLLVINQPKDKPVCGFFGWYTHFFSLLSTGYFLLLIHAWQKLVRGIDVPGRGVGTQGDSWLYKYWKDALGLTLVAVPAVGLTAGAMVQQSYEGTASTGTCLLDIRHGGSSYFYAFYALLVLFPSMFFLQKGIRHLKKMRTNVKSSKNQNALRALSRQLAFYLAIILLSILVHAWIGIYVLILIHEEKVNMAAVRHQTCIMISCMPKDCPAHPKASAELIMALWFVHTLSVVLLSMWAFRSRLLNRVPCFRAVVRASGLSLDSSISGMEKSQPVRSSVDLAD